MASSRRVSGWLVFAVVAIVLVGCLAAVAAGMGILFLIRSRESGPDPRPVDPTVTIRVIRTPTHVLLKMPTPQPSPTRTQPPALPTRTPTRTQVPSATTTPGPQATAAPTATSSLQGTPTPIVCEGIESAASLTLAPGQSFTCSVTDDELVDQIAKVPDLPCSDVQIAFDDGEIQVSCRMGIRLTAVGELSVQDCRATMAIVRGTPGFTQVVQTLLDQYAVLLPYDRVCVEEATVGDGVLTVSGYGK